MSTAGCVSQPVNSRAPRAIHQRKREMKMKLTLLLSMLLLAAGLTAAQTSPKANAVANSQAQALKPYGLQTRIVEKKMGEDTLSVNLEKGISTATEQALMGYFTEHYTITTIVVDIYRAPVADNLYFLMGTVNKDQKSVDSEPINIFLVLREQGGTVTLISKAVNENDSAIRAPLFFLGQNRILAIVSLSAPDGSLAGHYAYEYASDKLKPLGAIDVVDKMGMSGQVWITNNSLEGATAAYRNNTYYVTMRGRGSLYVPGGMDNYKKIAPPRSPVTYVYDKGSWRRVAAR
jgi:hypothetical protein